MPPPRKEHHAFMPSSNDSLHSPPYSNHNQSPDGIISPFQDPMMLPPSQASSSPAMSRGGHFTSGRKQVSSASSMPGLVSGTTNVSSIGGEAVWQDLCFEMEHNFARERATWVKRTELMRQENERLRAELAGRNKEAALVNGNGISPAGNGNGVSVASTAGNENRRPSDKLFFDQSIVNKANEKLAEISVVGTPHNSGRNTREGSKDDGVISPGSRRSPGLAARMESISEESPRKRVLIGGLEPGPVAEGGLRIPIVREDDPISPITTPKPMSPAPANYLLHAGHTPLVNPSRNPGVSVDDHLINDFKPATGILLAGTLHDGTEEDRELTSPKMLPTSPTGDLGGLDTLETLNQKLTQVAENPEENLPEAVKSQSAGGSDDESSDHADIPLRTKQTLNFGTQFGKFK